MAFCTVLLGYCVLVSPKKEIWVDEIYSRNLVADPSLRHALYALWNGVDGGMPLYYVLANGWAHIFGTSLMALRLFSTLCICAGLVVLFSALRRQFSFAASATSLALFGLNSTLLLTQDVELRFYGLMFFCASLVILAHQRLQATPSAGSLTFLWIAHALLIYSHPFGILYSAAALVGARSFRTVLVATSSWLTLLPWVSAFHRVRDLATPHNWITAPTLDDVLSVYQVPVVLALITLAVLFAIAFLNRPVERTRILGGPLLRQAWAFLAVPLLVAAISWKMTPIFVDRYFVASRIGLIVLAAYLFDRAVGRTALQIPARLAVTALIAVLLATPLVQAYRQPKHDYFQAKVLASQSSGPVIVENANVFLPMEYYADPQSRPYYYPLDWNSALHAASLHATVQTKLMNRLRENGYSADRFLDSRDIVCGFDHFMVIHDPGMAWFREHVQNNPAFAKTFAPVGPVSGWKVTRIATPQECAAP